MTGDYEKARAYLDSFINYERLPVDQQLAKDAIRLDRVEALAEMLGRPSDALCCVHIAGSKGKGSTAAIAASIFRAAGLRTGLYTSPHLVDLRERIQVDDRPIGRDAFTEHIERMRPHLEAVRAQPFERRATYFEVLTHLAFQYFRDAAVDVAVIEVGLGGRLDATNICRPVACAITRIDREHVRQLGDTLSLIAREKAGILKPGVPVAVCPGPDEAMEAIEQVAGEVGSPVYRFGHEFTVGPPDGDGRFTIETWRDRYERLELPHLLGAHQRQNAATALALALLAAERGAMAGIEKAPVALEWETVSRGLVQTKWPGRLEPVPLAGGRGLLDGAHTTASVAAALEACREHYGDMKISIVFGTHRDKDAAEMLALLSREACGIVLTGTGSPRAMAPAELADLLRAGARRELDVVCADEITDAIDQAREMAGPEGLILVIGSLYLVGRVKARGGSG